MVLTLLKVTQLICWKVKIALQFTLLTIKSPVMMQKVKALNSFHIVPKEPSHNVLIEPAWNSSFHQHSLNTTRSQFKTGRINQWVCSLKQPGKVYSRTWFFPPVSSWLLPLSSLQSLLTQGFSQEPGKQQWGVFCFPSAASALWFPRAAHTDPQSFSWSS